MLAQKNEDIKKAYSIHEIISKDEKARMAYEAREAAIKDEVTRMKSAEEKGKTEELIDTVMIQLKKKFKLDIIPTEIQQKIKSAQIDQLKKIRDDIFDITSLEDALKYLKE